MKKKRKPMKRSKLKNALKKSQLPKVLDSLSLEELAGFAHELRVYLNWWMGDPTKESLLALKKSQPHLDHLLDFDIVLNRLESLDSFERSPFGVNIKVFLPELTLIYESVVSQIQENPPGIHKAECWLKPIAQHAGADSDVEAAVYIASRGQADLIDIDSLRDSWHGAVCQDIEHGKPVGKVPQEVLNRAGARTVSLAEAATVLRYNNELPRFFSFRDEEENFIDAAMFRTVEWFGVTGFEPWLKSLIKDLSNGPQYGMEHVHASWWLFFWCRSDLAIGMAERQGLESWLWALINGPDERDKPWRCYWPDQKNPRSRDYLPLAGAILFIWCRIRPNNMKEDVLLRATDLLFQTQTRCGGWPLHADDSEADLIATCFAIHGLAAYMPSGWQKAVERGAKWIKSQQQAGGAWYISGGPPAMLTVLAIDSLDLAEGKRDVTFKLDVNPTENNTSSVPHSSSPRLIDPEPAYDYSAESWCNPEIPTTTSVTLSRAHEVATPRLAVMVATELELKQVLSVLTPLPRRRRIWKVAHGPDTFFLGRFGKFQCVLMLSSMASQGATGSTLSTDAVIREWNPTAVVLLGIAYGANRKKQHSADVLIAEHLIPYEHQRIGAKPMFRNPVPPSSPTLVNRFRHALDWQFHRPDGSRCSKHVGPILSGDKLIDDLKFKNLLLDQYPNAIGGEMEGAGLWSAAQRADKHWIIVKGVCDWADGHKHDSYQVMAAASAVSLANHVFSDSNILDGL
ncbi:MAG: hypothetical protein CEE38_21950 [Planctomycetes bacterium B3_Pla]|nr:MAG: hypothetical protein CEE38_21950 [Planctomycetes bacterium B3_Pla]